MSEIDKQIPSTLFLRRTSRKGKGEDLSRGRNLSKAEVLAKGHEGPDSAEDLSLDEYYWKSLRNANA